MSPYWAKGQPPQPAAVQPQHGFDPTQRRLVNYLAPGASRQECGDIVTSGIEADDRDRAGIAPEGEG